MSVYTEIVISCQLNVDTPSVVLDDIKQWLGLSADDIDLSKRQWFYDTFNIASYPQPGTIYRSLESGLNGYFLTLRSKIKNYDHDIEKFLIQLAPYNNISGFVGYVRNEFDEYPSLVFFRDKKVFYKKITAYIEIEVVTNP